MGRLEPRAHRSDVDRVFRGIENEPGEGRETRHPVRFGQPPQLRRPADPDRFAERGLGAKVHCTGDGSARLVLDVAERLRAEGLTTPIQIAHGQFLAEEDIPRLAALDVTADTID